MWTHQGNNGGRQEQVPLISTIGTCISKAVLDGYSECFKLTNRGLYAISKSRYYRPEQLQKVTIQRFDEQGDPAANGVVYVIETSDGLKGTLVDAFGVYSEGSIQTFMAEVEDIRSKVARHNQHEC